MSSVLEHASSIRCESLTIEYPGGPRAVDSVQLTVPPAEILSLIGPSGCGKTTLLRLMAALEAPTSGHVNLDPPVMGDRGGIAFVFQQPTLLPWRSAIENVMLPLELIDRGSSRQSTSQQKPSQQKPSRHRREIATQMLETVGLSDAMQRLPRQLSGGMKMRVSIARALVTEPNVLLLDEPFASLDDMLRNQLGQLLLQLWDEQRFTVVMVTHNVAEAVLLSHRVAVMHDGRISGMLDNPLPWPRTEGLKSSAEFGRFYGLVSARLRGEP